MIGRKSAIINLHPSSTTLLYDPIVDINELVSIDSVQDKLNVGPNGGMLYCFDYLLENIVWLITKLERLRNVFTYLLFDCPGQVELYTTQGSFVNIINQIKDKLHMHLATVNLVDYFLCNDSPRLISANLVSLSIIVNLELP